MKDREQVLELRENPNPETIETLDACVKMQENPEKYKGYASFKEEMKEISKD